MNERVNLDDLTLYPGLDPQGMLAHLHNFPDMSQQAWDLALKFRLPQAYSRVSKVVVLGMGGSGIGGDLVKSLASAESPIPIFTCREYDLPAYVDDRTLVIASSYSGATEETLTAFGQALKKRCPKLVVTTGGQLKDLAAAHGVPVFSYDYRAQPRAVLPYSFFPLLGILAGLKIIPDQIMAVAEGVAALRKLALEINETVPEGKNPAKQLAGRIFGKLVVIYGGDITGNVAQRWKGQFNENAKNLAYYETFSELNHNSVVGYSFPQQMPAQTMVVLLMSDWLHERIKLRYGITEELLRRAGFDFAEIKGRGAGRLAQMLTLVLFGDYVSYYLALLNRADPTPVTSIDYLKGRLAKGE